jgi:hypothetical protein
MAITTQIRLQQLTGSLPVSSKAAPESPPSLANGQDILDEIASSIRRVLDYDTTASSFFDAPATFRSMGTEGVFVATSDLYVTGTAYATSITGSGGLELVASNNGAVIIDGDSGATFTEDGTEVLIIDGNGDTRFASSGGSADDPDVEVDGYTRFDSDVAMSGSISLLGTATRHDIAKITTGNLVLSGAGGRIYLVDSHVTSSDWADKELGIPLAVSDSQWSSFYNLGFTSLLDALTSTGAQNKVTAKVVSPPSLGSATGLFTADVSAVPASDRTKRVDVYVNGMLQVSGSASDVSAGDADYRLTGTESSTDLIFSYLLAADDQIAIVIR